MKTLYLFTNNYPYSTPESFLEEEINYLSNKFDRVIILSFINKTLKMRPVPNNCEVINIPLSKNRIRYNLCGVFHHRTFFILLKDFFNSKVFLSKKRLKAWVSSARCINNYLYNKKLMDILRDVKKNDVCYYYWGIGQCLLSILLKGKCKNISRFHGEWDLWEESYGNYHPLRKEVVKNLNMAVFIAKHGEKYFKERYPNSSTIVCPLGTKDHGLQLDNPNDGIVRVISCSKIYPLKRVDLIFEALNNLNFLNIEWTHIGDGPDFEYLKSKIKKEKKNHITVNLLGRISNKEVLSFYKKHHFDMFVNMSTSEGVPVAIMEAMSFGIPILATNVGSTSEEVHPQVGELLSPNPSIEEINTAMCKILNSSYTPREFWLENYNADINYSKFTDILYSI